MPERVSETIRVVGGGEIELRNVHRAVASAAHVLAAYGPRAAAMRAGGAMRSVYLALSRLSESYERLVSVRLEGDVELEKVQQYHEFLERVYKEAIELNDKFQQIIRRIELERELG